MVVLKLGLLLILLPVCCFSPGFFLLRRTRWNPLEKLCGSVALSLIFLYLASVTIYGLGLDWGVAASLVAGICAALLVATIPDLRRLLANPTARKAIYGFASLLGWTLLLLAMIRHFSGGGWGTDWLEHFQRVLYFLHRFPKTSPIVEGYAIPARPPMLNLLGAFFLAPAGDRFEYFQLVFAFLNLLVLFPCFLIAPTLAFRGRRRILPLLAIFAASPVVMQNASYPWTKLLAAFFIILALWFYLRGWSKQDTVRMTAAFVFLAAAMLVHYSAGPYLVFVALHYLLALFWKRRHKWRELAAIASSAGLLLATWFVWSLAVYGLHSTVASNTTVTPSQRVEGSNAAKIAANFFDTVVPHPLRSDASTAILQQPSALGRFRDYFFLIYQTNAIFGIGLLGGPLVLYLLLRTEPRTLESGAFSAISTRPSRRTFWFSFIPFCLILGVAVHGERETFGVAHVTLQPLILLGLCLLAGSFARMPRPLAGILLAGCLLDFAVGVAPQALVENMENTPGETVFAGVTVVNGQLMIGQPQFLTQRAWQNWFAKHQYALTSKWIEQTNDPGLRAALQRTRSQDDLLWHGWYARHGGEMTFLGDAWPAGVALPFALWTALFLATLGALLRRLPQPLQPAAIKPAPPKKRRARS